MLTLIGMAYQRESILIMNTYFYTQLADPRRFPDDRVLKLLKKKLTPKIKYIVIPINLEEKQHWSLAIIANVNLNMT